jgi:hypothetical protein
MTQYHICEDCNTAFLVCMMPPARILFIFTAFTVKIKSVTVLREEPFHNRARHSGGIAPHAPKLSTWWRYLASFLFYFISWEIPPSTSCFGDWLGPRSSKVVNRRVYDPSRDRTPIYRSSNRCLVTTSTNIFTAYCNI